MRLFLMDDPADEVKLPLDLKASRISLAGYRYREVIGDSEEIEDLQDARECTSDCQE